MYIYIYIYIYTHYIFSHSFGLRAAGNHRLGKTITNK